MLPLCDANRNMDREQKGNFLSPKKKKATDQQHGSFHRADWHPQRLNLNFVSGKDRISGITSKDCVTERYSNASRTSKNLIMNINWLGNFKKNNLTAFEFFDG